MNLKVRRRQLARLRRSPSYITAYKDVDFLHREDLRPIRLQLELLKPEIFLQENKIRSTVVVFGSARIPAPEEAARGVRQAQRSFQRRPRVPHALQRLEAARRLAAKVHYYKEARRFAATVSRSCQVRGACDYVIVTGGGPGVMEAANRGAYEAGAKSIGLNITLPLEQEPNPYVSPELCFQFHYFALRKMHFLMRAKALVAFPGGYGTLDEIFEALTLVQTGKMDPFPILLFGRSFWERVVDFSFLVEEGVISPEDARLFEYVETAEEAWHKISGFYRRRPKKERGDA